MTLKELRDKRNKVVVEMRAILEKAKAEKHELTAEENGKYGELLATQDNLRKNIETEERQHELERDLAAQALKDEERDGKGKGKGKEGEEKPKSTRATPEYEAAFRRMVLDGERGITDQELRALSAGVNIEGGYIVAPEQFVNSLIKNVNDLVFVRNRATKFTVANAQSLGVPTLDADISDTDWTTELATGSEDSSLKLGKRNLYPHPLAKRVKISKTLIRIALQSPEALVNARLAYKVGISEEKAFLLGNGVNQPLGLMVASALGIPTSRDVSAGNTTTAIGMDGLIEAKYSVKAAYWPRASWAFHRDAMKQITKLKDGEGQYLWRPSVLEGEPDRLLGHAIDVSEYMPNTFTTGLYVGLFGDLSNYWIADALDMQMQILTELYAETNQNGYIIRKETDGMPVLSEAFSRVKMA